MARKPKQTDDSNQRVETVLRRLDASDLVCIDTETSGLDWKRQHIVGYVFTFGPADEDSYYLPFRHAAGGNLFNNPGPQTKDGWNPIDLHPAEKSLVSALDDPRKTVFGHNLSFDLKFLSRVGYTMSPRHEDTIINAPLLNEWQGRYSLEFCCNQAQVQAKKTGVIYDYIKAKFPDDKIGDKDAMGHYWRLAGNDPIAVEYAAGDGTSTWQLREWQMGQIAEQELQRVHDVESRLIPVLARMTIKGIKIDEERLAHVRDDVQSQIETLLEQFPPDFNPKATSDVQKWCTDNGVTNWPMTQHVKPRPSFTEAWLETHEPGQKIVSIRKLMTLRDSFITPMIEEHLFNGRVHTSFNQLKTDDFGTVTGRLSSSEPNLQQVPKHNKKSGKLFRSIFVPDRDMIWGSADYSQCEPRLLAYYSNCKVLIRGYTSKPEVDAHTAVTVEMYPTYLTMGKDQQKKLRDLGKRVNQTLITGGGKGVLVQKYKVPQDEVNELWTKYFEKMPEIKDLQSLAGRVMKQRGYVKSLLGRRARLRDPNLSYTAVNRLLQCGNADIIKQKMVEIDAYLASEGRPLDLLNNVHDALDYQFAPEVRKHYEECLNIMTRFGPTEAFDIGQIPMTVEADEGPNWSVATYGED